MGFSNMDSKYLDLYIYDESFSKVALLDAYESLIWSDRYNENGDFELTIPYQYGHDYFGKYLIQNNYCGIEYSNRLMMIEKIEYKTEEESAPQMIITGRSLESILERRLVLTKVEFGSDKKEVNLQNSIESLLNYNVIDPSNEKRKIKNFVFKPSTDENVTSITFSGAYNGENLYNIISEICKDKKIGFSIMLNDQNEFVFELFAGADHSTEQTKNTQIIFSPFYDTLKNSNYFTSNEDYRNLMFVSIEEGILLSAYEDQEPEDLNLREVLVDQDELLENKSTKLSSDQLIVKAKQKLKEDHKIKTGIEAEIIPGVLYEYGTDYNVGDIVQVTDIYGNTKSVRILEVVLSNDENGFSIVPTFEEI